MLDADTPGATAGAPDSQATESELLNRDGSINGEELARCVQALHMRMKDVLTQLADVISMLGVDPKQVAVFSAGLKLGMESGVLQRDVPAFTQHLSVRATQEHMRVLMIIEAAGEEFRSAIQHILSLLDGADQRKPDGRVD